MARQDYKVKMEILCKWNGNFHSAPLERKTLSDEYTFNGRPFVPENFRLIHAYHLHFKLLKRKFWPDGKRLKYFLL